MSRDKPVLEYKIVKAINEFFVILEGNIDEIIQNIFPLQYDKQEGAIKYILENLDKSSIEESKEFPEIKGEIEEINENKDSFKKYNDKKKDKDRLNPEQLKIVYQECAVLFKNDLLKEVKEKRKKIETSAKPSNLEETYAIKLRDSSPKEKAAVITEYKEKSVEARNSNIDKLKKEQENLRTGKPIEAMEEHFLVKEGILTSTEMAPIISNYPLLNMFQEYSAQTERVKGVFNIARNFYPNNPQQGINELGEIDYSKTHHLVNKNIQSLLANKQVSFKDLGNFADNYLSLLGTTDLLQLANAGLPVPELFKLSEEKQKFCIENVEQIKTLYIAGLPVPELFKLPEEKQEFCIKNSYEIYSVGLPVPKLFKLSEEEQKWLLENSSEISKLYDEGITLSQLFKAPLDRANFFINNSNLINVVSDNKSQLLEMPEQELQKCLIKNYQIKELDKAGLPVDQLLAMPDQKIQKLCVKNGYPIRALTDVGLPVDQLLAMPYEKVEKIVTDYKIEEFLKQKVLTPDDLQKCSLKQLEDLLNKKITPEIFKASVQAQKALSQVQNRTTPSTNPSISSSTPQSRKNSVDGVRRG